MNTLHPQFASSTVTPRSRARARVAQFEIQLTQKSGARDALHQMFMDARDDAQRIERSLPADCPYLGCTVADLAAVKVDRDARRRVGHPDSDLAWQLDEARRAAVHRERMADLKMQTDALSAECAELGQLIRNLVRYLDQQEQRA